MMFLPCYNYNSNVYIEVLNKFQTVPVLERYHVWNINEFLLLVGGRGTLNNPFFLCHSFLLPDVVKGSAILLYIGLHTENMK